jgi:methyl-accepting chemotaxis protein
MKAVATVARELTDSIGGIFDNLQGARASSDSIAGNTQALIGAHDAVSQMIEQCFQRYARVDLNTPFHRNLARAREFARRVRAIFERVIDEGRCTLDDVLALEYREIRGTEIQSLSRLFDVSHVPSQGFTPPKYATRYDAVVDVDLQQLMDEVKASDASLIICAVTDLNLYVPTYHADRSLAWTGDPDKDEIGNRTKRFFSDRRINADGARVGLSPIASQVSARASREEFALAGCELHEKPGDADAFSARPAVAKGTVILAIHVPVFVKGQRYGAVIYGWTDPDL